MDAGRVDTSGPRFRALLLAAVCIYPAGLLSPSREI